MIIEDMINIKLSFTVMRIVEKAIRKNNFKIGKSLVSIVQTV